MIVTLILPMRSTNHYVTSFIFLGSTVASKKPLIVKKFPFTESERESTSWRLRYLSQHYFLYGSGIHFQKILVDQNHCLSQGSLLPKHISRTGCLNFKSFATVWPASFNKSVIQFSFKIVFKNGDSCLKGLELFLDQRVISRCVRTGFTLISEPNF